MTTLQDVKAFVKMHSDLSKEDLEAKVAAEFSTNRYEAMQMLRGFLNEEIPAPSLLPSALIAMGLTGTSVGGMSQNAGLVAIVGDKHTTEPSQTAEKD